MPPTFISVIFWMFKSTGAPLTLKVTFPLLSPNATTGELHAPCDVEGRIIGIYRLTGEMLSDYKGAEILLERLPERVERLLTTWVGTRKNAQFWHRHLFETHRYSGEFFFTQVAFSRFLRMPTLLIACGGGGSSTTAAMTPTQDNPNTSPGEMPPPANVEDVEDLPRFLATQDLGTLRNRFSGTAPTITDEARIISGVQMTATATNRITMQNIVVPGEAGIFGTPIIPDCSANTSCTAGIPDVETVTFSLADIEDLSLIDNEGLERSNSETRAIMDVGEVKVIESTSAGLDSDGTRLAFQTYGGWLDGNVFGFRRIEVIEGSDRAVYFASYSFGKANGSDPSGMGPATWSGVAVGIRRNDRIPIQGTATIDIDDLDAPDVDVSFSFRELPGGTTTADRWDNLSLNNGTFTDGISTGGGRYIEGTFYGDNHEEVGGIFRTLNLYGAFGARRVTQ